MESFIQFYEIDNILRLRNSFSSVWSVIKNRGEIIWIDPTKNIFPDVNGTVYISCTFEQDLDYTKKWVSLRPDVEFIVGGPAVIYMQYNSNIPNLKTDNRQMFEVLGVEPTKDLWGISIPITIPDHMYVYYNYSLAFGNQCYWGKCNFCRTETRKETTVDVERIPILKPYHNVIWLNQQAITPRNILNLFPNFSEESIYSFYLRADHSVQNTLNKVPINNSLRPMIGVEFPSDRMLKLMNKGIDTETLLNTVLLFLQNGCHVILTIIHAWPNLDESDVRSVEYFLNKIEPFKKQINCVNHWLFTHEKEDNTIPCMTKYGKPYYIYKLSKEQEDLNNKVLELYKSIDFWSYSDNFESKLSGAIHE